MKTAFIINPNAGKETVQSHLLAELKARNIEYHLTEYAGHAKEIAREIAESGEEVRIFSCGGEGTNYEVLNGIVGKDNVTLGLVPCGTGNDFLKYFGNNGAFLNLEDQFDGSEFYLDIIKVKAEDREYYGLNSCSAGMDAMVCENAIKFKKLPFVNKLSYELAIAKTLLQKFGKKIDFIIDGKEHIGIPSLFAVCANAPFYGGGYKCAPDANPSDGKLNYSIIATRSKLRTLTILGKYKKGTHTSLKICHHGECEEMIYKTDSPVAFNIDGEVYKFSDVICSVVSRGVKLWLPKTVAASHGSMLTPVEKSVVMA